MIFMFKPSANQYYIAEAQSIEEGTIKAFNMDMSVRIGATGRRMEIGGLEFIECPEILASTAETRELLYGIR